MKVVLCKEFGFFEKFVVEDVLDFVVGEGEVVVDVKVVLIIFLDMLVIENKYQYKQEFFFILGSEVLGVVVVVGVGVEGFVVGDVVIGGGFLGGFVEKVVVEVSKLCLLFEGFDFVEVMGLGYVYGMVYYGFCYCGDFVEGEMLFVIGVFGVVGLVVIEIGKVFGVKVIVVVLSDEKFVFCCEYGVDEMINYFEEDLKVCVKELIGGKGVDVVYDVVGGDCVEQVLCVIGWCGCFLVIGFIVGILILLFNLILFKGCDICGVFWGVLCMQEFEIFEWVVCEVDEFVVQGYLKLLIMCCYGVEQIFQVLCDMIDCKVIGKVVMVND